MLEVEKTLTVGGDVLNLPHLGDIIENGAEVCDRRYSNRVTGADNQRIKSACNVEADLRN